MQALEGKPVIPAPAGHGWVMVEDALTVAWMGNGGEHTDCGMDGRKASA